MTQDQLLDAFWCRLLISFTLFQISHSLAVILTLKLMLLLELHFIFWLSSTQLIACSFRIQRINIPECGDHINCRYLTTCLLSNCQIYLLEVLLVCQMLNRWIVIFIVPFNWLLRGISLNHFWFLSFWDNFFFRVWIRIVRINSTLQVVSLTH